MIKNIVRDRFFLMQKSEKATAADLQVVRDLKDTLEANRDRCVGMAANMIGERKRIIIVYDKDTDADLIMINPEIVRKLGPYETQEGCLSLDGVRDTTRYERIQIRYEDESFQTREKWYGGLTAQIIQHEMDHCEGTLI